MRNLIIGLTTLFLVLFAWGEVTFDLKNRIIQYFNFTDGGELQNRIKDLERENQNLRSQVLLQTIEKKESVKVYSEYPFSNRGEISIAAGEDQGIKVGNIVTYGNNILVGKVAKVFPSSSIVTTVFNPSWEMAVRIGQGETDALMKGGNELKLTLIQGKATIAEGELVISATKDFPYGLGLGSIKNIRDAAGGVFKEASLEPGFKLKELRDVIVHH